MRIPILFSLILTALLAFLPLAASAQGDTPRATQSDLREVIDVLRDDTRREKLLQELETLLSAMESTAPTKETTPLEELASTFARISEGIETTALQAVAQGKTIPDRASGFVTRIRDPKARAAFLRDAGLVLAALAAAIAGAFLVSLTLRRIAAALRAEGSAAPLPLPSRIGRSGARLLLELLPPAAMLALAFGGLSVLPGSPSANAIALAIVAAIALRRAAAALVRFPLTPDDPAIRPIDLSDEDAKGLARGLGRLATIGIYGFFLVAVVRACGAESEFLEPLRNVYGLVLLASGILFVLRHRRLAGAADRAAAAAEAGAPAETEPESKGRPRWTVFLAPFARLWWIGAILYMLGLYAIWIGQVEGAFLLAVRASALTALALGGAILAIVLVHHALERLSERLAEQVARYPSLRDRIPTYAATARVVASAAILILAASFALESWGVAALAALSSTLARSVLSVLIQLFLTVLAAMAAVDIATAATQSYLTRREKRGRASAKVLTLVPLANKAIKVVVTVIAGIMILSEIGVQIAPLLAGVGVLGLAVGFGAQTLVKDIITGVFMLAEDSVAVGDVVMVDGTGGLVEAINIRTIRLRDLQGSVHLIPYSSVTKVTNMTKDYSRYVADIGVAYREDVDEVIGILKEVGEDLRKDPEFGKHILQPLEVFGLDRFEDSAVVIRTRLTTKPIKQWDTGREFLRRVKKAFDERGIEIPFPHRTIYMGEDKKGTAPPLFIRELHVGGETGGVSAEMKAEPVSQTSGPTR